MFCLKVNQNYYLELVTQMKPMNFNDSIIIIQHYNLIKIKEFYKLCYAINDDVYFYFFLIYLFNKNLKGCYK